MMPSLSPSITRKGIEMGVETIVECHSYIHCWQDTCKDNAEQA